MRAFSRRLAKAELYEDPWHARIRDPLWARFCEGLVVALASPTTTLAKLRALEKS